MPVSAPKTSPLAAVVDEIGALELELAAVAAKQTRLKQLRERVRDAFAKVDAERDFEVQGEKYIATLGPKADERTVDTVLLAKAVGAKRFREIAGVTLKAVETAFPALLDSVVRYSRTGTRPLKISARGGV